MKKRKPGPSPKAADRYPGGKLKPATQSGNAPALVRRIIDKARTNANDTLLSGPLGWLRLHNKITDSQAAAGLEYARLRACYDRAIDAPRRTVCSPAYGAAFGNITSIPTEAQDQSRKSEWVRRMYAAEKLLTMPPHLVGSSTESGAAGMPGARRRASIIALLDRVCVENEPASAWEIPDLEAALDRLSVHFGFAYTRKRA